jgi:hypothetical protein
VTRPSDAYVYFRRPAQAAAAFLGLRIEIFLRPGGERVYALWPEEGLRWELADPPVATTWAGIYRLLWLIIYRGPLHGD